MAAAKGSLHRQQAESIEIFKDLSVSKDDEDVQAIPKEMLLDLSFLNDQERRTLIKVIKADQEFRKNTLETLKRNIERGRQFQELQTQSKSTQDEPEKCTCCGLVLKTICSKTWSTKCLSCKNTVCKNCRKGDIKNSTCVLCVKEKLMDLQTLDYMPVLKKSGEVEGESTDGGSKPPPQFYGSVLIKESLAQDPAQPDNPPKSVTIQEKSKTPEPPAVLGSMMTPVAKERRSRSLQPPSAIEIQRSTDVNDPSSGFKLIKQERSEESLDDICSLYSEPDYNTDTTGGKIKLGVWYRTDENTLYVHVGKAKKLVSVDGRKPDPYVRMHLLPNKTKQTKRRTGIQRKTDSPKFDEILKYGKLEVAELPTRTLWVTVWHWDKHGRNKFLGEVRLQLSSLDLTNSTDIAYDLHEYMDDSDIDDIDLPGSKGKLHLALKYNFHESAKTASMQRSVSTTLVDLHVKVLKAEGLPMMDPAGSTNPFVRAYLLPNKTTAAKKKTKVIFNNTDPVWEEEMTYPLVPLNELETSRVLELTLWDHDRRGINGFIGGLRIGPDPIVAANPEMWMDSSTDESSHWEAMLSQQGEWVEQCHMLRPCMDPQQLIKKRRKTSVSAVNVSISMSSISSSSLPPDDADPTSKASTLSRSTPQPEPVDIKSKKKVVPPPSITITRGARGDYKITGEVLVGIEYKDGQLQVKINRAIKLAAVGKTGSSNPYIKLYLLPDSSKKSKIKTSIKKKTVDPIFNETLQYKISKEDVTSRAMWLTVWSAGRLGNQFLGEACIPLGSLDLSDPGDQWYQLHDFVESGVVLPSNLTGSASPLPGHTPSHHRTRAHAFSRSPTPGSRRGSSKSSESLDKMPHTPPLARGRSASKSSLVHQASVDSEAAPDPHHLLIAQGEKRGSSDSIIPVITVDNEIDKEN